MYKLVPIEPSNEMHEILNRLGETLNANPHSRDDYNWYAIKAYRAMVNNSRDISESKIEQIAYLIDPVPFNKWQSCYDTCIDMGVESNKATTITNWLFETQKIDVIRKAKRIIEILTENS